MRDTGAEAGTAATYGRIPARVLLLGEADGWRCVVVDKTDAEECLALSAAGALWPEQDAPEPSWWPRRVAEDAEALRGAVERALTDRTFAELGVEAEISWFAVEEPVAWEGLVTLRDADAARTPGGVPPFVITLEPGRGAVLPEAHLLFTTAADDAWATLAAVADRCGAPAPEESFLCGWADHRGVRVGRGRLALSTERGDDGVERLGEIFGSREPGWSGNPELRFRLDGIDLLDEPADDVVALFRDLGHEVVRKGRTARLPAMGLTLYEPERALRSALLPGTDSETDAAAASAEPKRFSGVSLQLPHALASLWNRP